MTDYFYTLRLKLIHTFIGAAACPRGAFQQMNSPYYYYGKEIL